jgi:hypothetical protein
MKKALLKYYQLYNVAPDTEFEVYTVAEIDRYSYDEDFQFSQFSKDSKFIYLDRKWQYFSDEELIFI